jgi:hypothetical protein
MQTQMNCCSSQIILLVHDVIHASWTQLHIEGGNITGSMKKQIKCRTISLKLINNVIIPNYFISTFVNKKEIIGIISTLQMAQATSFSKVQVEIVLNVSHFNLVPHMVIIFPIHSLHLTKVTVGTNKRG